MPVQTRQPALQALLEHALVHLQADHVLVKVVAHVQFHHGAQRPEGVLLGHVQQQEAGHKVHTLAVAHRRIASRVGEQHAAQRVAEAERTREARVTREGARHVLQHLLHHRPATGDRRRRDRGRAGGARGRRTRRRSRALLRVSRSRDRGRRSGGLPCQRVGRRGGQTTIALVHHLIAQLSVGTRVLGGQLGTAAEREPDHTASLVRQTAPDQPQKPGRVPARLVAAAEQLRLSGQQHLPLLMGTPLGTPPRLLARGLGTENASRGALRQRKAVAIPVGAGLVLCSGRRVDRLDAAAGQPSTVRSPAGVPRRSVASTAATPRRTTTTACGTIARQVGGVVHARRSRGGVAVRLVLGGERRGQFRRCGRGEARVRCTTPNSQLHSRVVAGALLGGRALGR
mmetsp:Transcript_38083/g.95811  ORF Transcript_38083/g.95811 Transcript_38083/m.95811 type:complete len:399 (+) Transcript_38083:1091-2287(+)